MNCEKYKNMIPEYISGELEEIEKSEFKAHVEECRECSKALDFEISVLNSISENTVELPPGLNETILSQLPVKKPIFHTNFIRYAVAASFFFLMIISYFMFDPALERDMADLTNTTVEKNENSTNNYYSKYVLGLEYDELISYNALLYDDAKWTLDNTDIFDSESDIINDFLMLEELESYDTYITSL